MEAGEHFDESYSSDSDIRKIKEARGVAGLEVGMETDFVEDKEDFTIESFSLLHPLKQPSSSSKKQQK